MIGGKSLYEIYKVLRNYEGEFLPTEIPQKAIELIKKSATYAPFAPNPAQGWKYAFLSKERTNELGFDAPLSILCFHASVKDEPNKLAQKGALFAGIYNMRLQAIVMGIVSRLVLDIEPYVQKAYDITALSDEEWEFSAILLMGYPSQKVKLYIPERDVIWRIE